MTQPVNTHSRRIDEPLYNSRIIKFFIDYAAKNHPNINIDNILHDSWINTYELEDEGHWFSQWQVDRFYELLQKEIGDPSMARKVGRYASLSSQNVQKQYLLGLIDLVNVYALMKKIYPLLSRAADIETKKIGSNKVQINVTPKPGVDEKLYQCENRIGLFESIAMLFTKRYANVEHTSCFHKGDDCCSYIISWEKTSSFIWKRVKSYSLLISIILIISLFFVLPLFNWIILLILCSFLTMTLGYNSERHENEELFRTVQLQGNAAEDLIGEINTRYNNARLIQEIGEATSMVMNINKLLKSIMRVMEKRLDFDRGGIWLANKERTRLIWEVGYGYDNKMEMILRGKQFQLNNINSKGIGVQAFRKKRSFIVNEISEIEKDLSKNSLDFIKSIGTQSFICVPILFKEQALGLLFVDNVISKRPLTQSHMSLLMGIAPQIAVSIHNATSYHMLKESKERERNIRRLFERYVPPSVIRRYVSGNVDLFRGEESAITALFLDIRGFTSSSENMDPADVVSFLNDYFEKCSEIIEEEHGHINKYTGDGFLSIFGAPEPLENHVELGFNAAHRIMNLSNEYMLGDTPMQVGIGLHTGTAILGNLGSSRKMEYTAIGDTVNTAARLQELTKLFHEYPVIISKDILEKLGKDNPNVYKIKALGLQVIRGKRVKLETFGFDPFKEDTVVMFHESRGLNPLQINKGVYVNRLGSKKNSLKSKKKAS